MIEEDYLIKPVTDAVIAAGLTEDKIHTFKNPGLPAEIKYYYAKDEPN